jgi:hypothetical protein
LANLIRGFVQTVAKPFVDAERAMKAFDANVPFKPSPRLTPALMKQFFDDGFVVVPGAVSEQLRFVAKRAINRSLGRGKDALPANSPWRHVPKLISSCPELMMAPEVTNLFNESEAIGCVHALLGHTVNKIWAGQIALRFPGDGCVPSEVYQDANAIGRFVIRQGLRVADAQQRKVDDGSFANPQEDPDYQVLPGWHSSWHIDGWPSPLNEKHDGIENFTCLVGVMLSDADEPLHGNLSAFPGSHHVLEQCINEAGGPEKLFADAAAFQTADAMRDPQNVSIAKLQAIADKRLSKPVQVRAKAGDVVIAHYQTAHSIAPNVSEDVRYCVYFRVTHSRRKEKSYAPECLTNIWLEFEGLRSALGVPLQRNLPAVAAPAPAPAAVAVTPEYAAAQATLAEAEKERAAGHLKIALALFERGLDAALVARSGLNEAARAATSKQLEDALSAAEGIKEQLAKK